MATRQAEPRLSEGALPNEDDVFQTAPISPLYFFFCPKLLLRLSIFFFQRFLYFYFFSIVILFYNCVLADAFHCFPFFLRQQFPPRFAHRFVALRLGHLGSWLVSTPPLVQAPRGFLWPTLEYISTALFFFPHWTFDIPNRFSI